MEGGALLSTSTHRLDREGLYCVSSTRPWTLWPPHFPPGPSPGPKVRAMEIIDELEPTRRGPTRGATGYYCIDVRLDTCITLRTAP